MHCDILVSRGAEGEEEGEDKDEEIQKTWSKEEVPKGGSKPNLTPNIFMPDPMAASTNRRLSALTPILPAGSKLAV
jgi:hypothetical protein